LLLINFVLKLLFERANLAFRVKIFRFLNQIQLVLPNLNFTALYEKVAGIVNFAPLNGAEVCSQQNILYHLEYFLLFTIVVVRTMSSQGLAERVVITTGRQGVSDGIATLQHNLMSWRSCLLLNHI